MPDMARREQGLAGGVKEEIHGLAEARSLLQPEKRQQISSQIESISLHFPLTDW